MAGKSIFIRRRRGVINANTEYRIFKNSVNQFLTCSHISGQYIVVT